MAQVVLFDPALVVEASAEVKKFWMFDLANHMLAASAHKPWTSFKPHFDKFYSKVVPEVKGKDNKEGNAEELAEEAKTEDLDKKKESEEEAKDD